MDSRTQVILYTNYHQCSNQRLLPHLQDMERQPSSLLQVHCPIITEAFSKLEKSYNCVEQYLMFQKAWLFKDEETAERIMASEDPKEQKRLGYRVNGLRKDVWESNRDRIMKVSLEAKFEQSEPCRSFLKGTQKTRLVEANPDDRYWGAGLGLRDKDIWNHNKWKGQNKLGDMLMEIREKL